MRHQKTMHFIVIISTQLYLTGNNAFPPHDSDNVDIVHNMDRHMSEHMSKCCNTTIIYPLSLLVATP